MKNLTARTIRRGILRGILALAPAALTLPFLSGCRDNDAWTPLEQAEADEYLQEHGANAIVHYLTENDFQDEKRTLNYLKHFVSQEADVNAKTENGWTPLHFAAWKGNLEAVKLLTAKDADVNVKMKYGYPSSAPTEKYQRSWDINLAGGKTPLYFAVESGNLEIVKLLVSKGADVNAQNDNGITPFEIAQILSTYSLGSASDPADFGLSGLSKISSKNDKWRNIFHYLASETEKNPATPTTPDSENILNYL